MRNIQQLAEVAAAIAARGAQEYLRSHSLEADHDRLIECLRHWTKKQWFEAIADAKEAMACNMGQIAEMTFKATMLQAGIEAAKEATSQVPRDWPAYSATLGQG